MFTFNYLKEKWLEKCSDKKVMRKKYEQQVAEQRIMRKLLIEGILSEGHTLGGIAFYEPKHIDTGCFCEEGFAILQDLLI